MAGINLTEIQQKVDRLLFNVAEQNRRAYEVFFSPTPAEVELPQLDENGNLTTVKIPNRALIKKQFWDDVGGAIGQWNRTLYVHPDGDNNAPGTADAPLATLKKAVDSIPIGGQGTIILLADIVNTDELFLFNRHITIQSSSATEYKKLKFPVVQSGNYNTINGFKNAEGSVRFKHIDFEFDTSSVDADLLYNSFAQVISYRTDFGNSTSIFLDQCTVNLPDDSHIQFLAARASGNHFCSVGLYKTTINTKSNSYFAILVDGSLAINKYVDVVLNGDKTSWGDLICGIIRDSNGIPRNVLSNIVL